VNQFDDGPSAALTRRRPTVVVSGVASDSHTWNLVFLQLLIEELGYDVVNLGPCAPDELLVGACRDLSPELIVISSVNGHGCQDGLRLIHKLRACEPLVATPIVIGGKLGVGGERNVANVERLVAAGYDAVFDDTSRAMLDFRGFVRSVSAARVELAENVETIA
jgi:methylaspartate mutase sigma subunit